ncbi:ABC transporter permease [Isoptericola hypogeus]|uniref:Oligopeptide transport system permease protein OppC n=1 Tax=Isoptericola hypogeus TaxID=300179 RepID=A0ABP4VH15_9MICO
MTDRILPPSTGMAELERELEHQEPGHVDPGTVAGAAGGVVGAGAAPTARGARKWRLYLRRFVRNRMAVVGVVVFVAIALLGIVGPLISDYTYDEVDFLAINDPPGGDHWLGTTGAGNDLFAQLTHGIQRSLLIGLVVSLATTLIAAFVGAIAAYVGGWVERAILEVIHFLLIVPSFLILALVSNDVNGDWRMLIVVLALFGWMYYARIVWTMALSVREREFVAAARYMGLGPWAVVRRHIVPNIGSMLTIYFTLGVVTTIQAETGLSFLGFGVKEPDTSLGALIGEGSSLVYSAPWMFWFPAITLTLLTVSMAFIADGLRDALDPTSQAGGRA